jgi:hypothetical protein
MTRQQTRLLLSASLLVSKIACFGENPVLTKHRVFAYNGNSKGEAMQFEMALKVWGAQRLSSSSNKVDPESVSVFMEFDEGYACCGGTQEGCYCSYAYGPSANVVISDGSMRVNISADDFDFAEILGEIVKAADGAITT